MAQNEYGEGNRRDIPVPRSSKGSFMPALVLFGALMAIPAFGALIASDASPRQAHQTAKTFFGLPLE